MQNEVTYLITEEYKEINDLKETIIELIVVNIISKPNEL